MLMLIGRMLVGYAVKLTSISALYVYMYLENKRRDRAANDAFGEDLVEDGIERGMMVSLFSTCSDFLMDTNVYKRIKRNLKIRHLDMCCELLASTICRRCRTKSIKSFSVYSCSFFDSMKRRE